MISLIAAPHVIESYLLLYLEYSLPYIGLSPYIAASFALSAAAYSGISFVNAHTSEIIQPLLNGADCNIVSDYDRNATSIWSSIWSFFFGNSENTIRVYDTIHSPDTVNNKLNQSSSWFTELLVNIVNLFPTNIIVGSSSSSTPVSSASIAREEQTSNQQLADAYNSSRVEILDETSCNLQNNAR